MAMADNIDYRFFLPGDEKGIIDLLKISFPGWEELKKNALPLWRWRYLEPPIKPLIVVVTDGDKIAGVDHKNLLQLKIGDAIHLAAYSDNVAVHPDYRSRGIYKEMLNLSLNYRRDRCVTYSYYSTENPIITNTDQRYGFRKFPYYLSHLVKIIDSDRYLKEKKRDDLVTKLGVKVLAGYTGITHPAYSQPKTIDDYSIVEVSSFDDRINNFWMEIKDNYGYIIEKTPDYMNWRNQRPTDNNVIKLAIKGSRILGYIVTSFDKEEDNLEGKISDLLTISNRLDVADALLKNACDSFVSDGAAAVYYPATKGHPYEELAQRNGFIDASRLKSVYFYYLIHSNDVDNTYIENLSPSKVQLQHF
jgi:GNAT superfamily N-acetyltransferase